MADRESDLIRRCAERTPEAWDEIVRRYAGLIYRTVQIALGTNRGLDPQSEIEDVVQTIFLKLWEDDCRRLRTFQGRSSFSTWLVAVARREALRFLEKRIRYDVSVRERKESAAIAGLVKEIENDPVADMRDKINLATSRLSSRDQLLIRLIYFDGASYEETAQLMAIPVNSVSPLLSRAKEHLRSLLIKDERMQ